jgi:hypothetical protein
LFHCSIATSSSCASSTGGGISLTGTLDELMSEMVASEST